MPVSSTWTNPSAAGTLDLATGAILTETWTDAVASNFLYLAGSAGVVTQRAMSIGLTPNPTTASASLVDLDGNGSGNVLRVNMTTTGGDVLALFVATVSNGTANASTQSCIFLDATGSFALTASSAVANANCNLANAYLFAAPSAAAHVIKVQWSAPTGGTSTASGVLRALIAIELRR